MNFHALLLSLAVVTTPAIAVAARDAAADKAMHDYVLTMPKMQGYDAASKALQNASKTDPALKAEGEKMQNEPGKTFADLKAKFTHHPKLLAFYTKQGLSADDAILIPLTTMQACAVAQYPQMAKSLAATVSPGQVAFCKQYMSELKKLSFFNGSGNESDE